MPLRHAFVFSMRFDEVIRSRFLVACIIIILTSYNQTRVRSMFVNFVILLSMHCVAKIVYLFRSTYQYYC